MVAAKADFVGAITRDRATVANLKHYPDKPFEHSPASIEKWDNGDHICQQKGDGWRLEICKGKGTIAYLTRHNTDYTAQMEDHLKTQMEIISTVLPDRSQLDSEWLSMRACTNKKTKPKLLLFDVYRYDKKWLLQTYYEERWALLQEILSQIDPALIPDIELVPTAEDGKFVEFYEAQKKLPRSEGIVVKHKKSLLIGSRKESKENPRWFKVKFRQGSDGEMSMEHIRGGKGRW
jgi:ATP-dependent DNA ligase